MRTETEIFEKIFLATFVAKLGRDVEDETAKLLLECKAVSANAEVPLDLPSDRQDR